MTKRKRKKNNGKCYICGVKVIPAWTYCDRCKVNKEGNKDIR